MIYTFSAIPIKIPDEFAEIDKLILKYVRKCKGPRKAESILKKSHKEIRKEYTYNKLKGLGQEIIEEIEKKKVPSVKVPSRGTTNIVYDDAKRYYVLGDKYGRRSLGNVKQIRKLCTALSS